MALDSPPPNDPAPEAKTSEKCEARLDDGLTKSKTGSQKNECEAIKIFESVIQATDVPDKTLSRAYRLLGCSHYKLGNYHTSLEHFKNATKKDSQDIFSQIMIGQTLLHLNRILPAQNAFAQAMEKVRGLEEIRDMKGTWTTLRHILEAYLQIGINESKRDNDLVALEYFARAKEVYEKYSRIDPANDDERRDIEKCLYAHYHIEVAICFSRHSLGMDSAKDELQKIIDELKPMETSEPRRKNLLSAYLVHGFICLERDLIDSDALATADKAIDLLKICDEGVQRKYTASVYLNKGLMLKKQQKFEEAIQCFTEGITRSGTLSHGAQNESNLRYRRGLTYIEMQKYDEGIRDLQVLKRTDQQFFSLDIALVEAFRKRALQNSELEFQHTLLTNFVKTVSRTQKILSNLSEEMCSSLNSVKWMYTLHFAIGAIIFVGAFAWTVLNPAGVASSPWVPAIGLIGGIDVILSMMYYSPVKVQKNRIDYSQWLMGYYNWVNTQFIAGMIISERLMKSHAPVHRDDETFDWTFAEPVQSYLHTMTKEMMDSIEKCCEFPDVQYSLSKKTEAKTSEPAAKDGQSKEAGKEAAVPSGGSDAASAGKAGAEVKNVSTAPAAKSAAAQTEKPNLPSGYTLIGSGNTLNPGHAIEGADLSRGIPAVVNKCWQGAAVDNRYISLPHLEQGITAWSGAAPEPLSTPFFFDDVQKKDINLLFAVIGKRTAIIQIGIQFLYLDEKGKYTDVPSNMDYYKAKKDGKEVYFVKYHEDTPLTQQIFGSGGNQVSINYVELPHEYEISKAIGKHYVIFKIAEIIPGQSDYVVKDGVIRPREIEWLWESDPFEFTIIEKPQTEEKPK